MHVRSGARVTRDEVSDGPSGRAFQRVRPYEWARALTAGVGTTGVLVAVVVAIFHPVSKAIWLPAWLVLGLLLARVIVVGERHAAASGRKRRQDWAG